jgi:peptide deformylase
MPKLIKYPNRLLTTETVNWDFVTGNKTLLLDTVKSMEELLKQKPDGVALSANQAGYNMRLFVVTEQIAEEYSIPTVIINPTINPVGPRFTEEREGCLSFPGLFFPIKRHNVVSCDFYDVDGNKRIAIVENFGARIFQHECEHLDGKLYLCNLPVRERYQMIGKYKNRNF